MLSAWSCQFSYVAIQVWWKFKIMDCLTTYFFGKEKIISQKVPSVISERKFLRGSLHRCNFRSYTHVTVITSDSIFRQASTSARLDFGDATRSYWHSSCGGAQPCAVLSFCWMNMNFKIFVVLSQSLTWILTISSQLYVMLSQPMYLKL